MIVRLDSQALAKERVGCGVWMFPATHGKEVMLASVFSECSEQVGSLLSLLFSTCVCVDPQPVVLGQATCKRRTGFDALVPGNASYHCH